MNINSIISMLEDASNNNEAIYVDYTNAEGITNEFEIRDIRINKHFGSHCFDHKGYIDAFCGTEDDENYGDYYTFKISRFNHICRA